LAYDGNEDRMMEQEIVEDDIENGSPNYL